MDNPSMTWLPDMEMEEASHIMKHQQTHPYCSNSVDLFTSEGFKGYPNMVTANQSIQLTTNGDLDKQQDQPRSKATKTDPFDQRHGSSSNTFTISFGNPTSDINQFQPNERSNLDAMIPKEETSLNEFLGSIDCTTRFRSTRRNHRQAQEHVLAERKRREKLAERFISLSALLPGLKKMDKATVLEDACNYILQLQSRVKELEGTFVKGKDNIIIQESAVSLGRSKFYGNHDDIASSSDDTNYLASTSTCSPEIKARISGNKILLRIYCMKSSSSLVLKTLTEMDRLHITIICCSVLPFNTAHLVAITAQMSDEMVITAKYLVQCLQSALRDFH